MKRKRKLPLLAALAGVVALVLAAVAAATTFDPNGTYTPLGGTTLHQTPPISNTSLTPQCTSAELASLPPGGVLWHFVLTQTTTLNTGVLRADFQTAGLTDPDVAYSALNGGNPQWNIITPTADTLLNASTDSVGSQLNLSHVCYVEKASPSIVTDPGDSGETGDTLNDTATLSLGNSPTGTITFKLFGPTDTTCSSDPIYTDVVDVNGNGVYGTTTDGDNPGGYVALVKGTYNWTADYSGDSANFPASSGCGEEALVVAAAAPTVLTEIHLGKSADESDPPGPTVVGGDTHVDLGSTVHDKGTVTGPAALGTPTGSVDFKFYKGDDCANGGDDVDGVPDVQVGSTSNVPLDSNGVAHPSADFGPLGAGSYYFTAHFNTGDENVWSDSDSTCEPLTVDKAQLTIVTQIHDASHNDVGGDTHVPLGSVVHDTATVTGAVPGFDPTGAISFTLNGNPVANADPAEAGFTASTVDSDPLAAGSYTYAASVAGDPNYFGDTSDDEPLTVDQSNTTTRTSVVREDTGAIVPLNGNLPVGTSVHDTATVGTQVGSFVISGTVTYHFYNSIDCTSNEITSLNGNTWPQTVTIDGSGIVPDSQSTGALAGGGYGFQAVYSGDSNYKGSTGACEPFTIRTFGYTMGFWGNTNGQALLAANHAFTTPLFDNQFAAGYAVTIGVKNGGCYIVVDSASKSKTILPNTLNGLSILQNCGGTTYLDSGINGNSMNTLLAQTLALSYNILYKSGFAGQSIGGMGCTAVGTLTPTSTVEDARSYANYLIQNAKKNYGAVITQSQIGLMNTLLGCINSEA